MFDQFDEEFDKMEGTNNSLKKKEDTSYQKLDTLKNALANQDKKKELDEDFKYLVEFLGEEMQHLESLFDEWPEQADNIIRALEEMLKDSTPDKSADYFEEKDLISRYLQNVKKSKSELDRDLPIF